MLLFGRFLRRAGIDVQHSRLIDALRAMQTLGITRRDDTRATLRAMLVHRHEDLERFDSAFDLFFHSGSATGASVRRQSHLDRATPEPAQSHASAARPLETGSDLAPSGPERTAGAYSASALSRTKDFAAFTSAELDRARHLLMHLPWRLGRRRTRRWERASGDSVDLRPTLRQLLTRGEIIELTYRRRRTAPRPLVVLGDVSGSMERYSRILLYFVYGLARTARNVESFVFATTLTRISRRLAERGANRELTRVIRDVNDWGGGTRIGESMRIFNTRWARRVMRHGPVVLIVSDGWDRGEPALVAREIARLRRSCRRLIWLNPLLGSPGYEPLTRGMQAALPFVDDFLPVHNIASLQHLAEHLRTLILLRRLRPSTAAQGTPSNVEGRCLRRLRDVTSAAGVSTHDLTTHPPACHWSGTGHGLRDASRVGGHTIRANACAAARRVRALGAAPGATHAAVSRRQVAGVRHHAIEPSERAPRSRQARAVQPR